ncbi:MAG TPA: TorF family putative porin [Gammaproteobacteria bacterium]|nr:TorF family putative porin [Gammaproteobacteria bacterium]
MNRKTLVSMTALGIVAVPSMAAAEFSANAGWVSHYIFRGFYQSESSASAGLDYESGGFYIGTWGADVGDGLEYDVYFGYGGGSDDFTWSVGYTAYRYTEDTYDDDYDEINLGVGFGGFSLDVALGEYSNYGPEVDYTYIGLGYALEGGTSFLIAQTDFDGVGGSSGADGIWFEASHSWTIADELELYATYLYSPDGDDPNSTIVLSGDNPFSEHALIFGVSAGFSIGN